MNVSLYICESKLPSGRPVCQEIGAGDVFGVFSSLQPEGDGFLGKTLIYSLPGMILPAGRRRFFTGPRAAGETLRNPRGGRNGIEAEADTHGAKGLFRTAASGPDVHAVREGREIRPSRKRSPCAKYSGGYQGREQQAEEDCRSGETDGAVGEDEGGKGGGFPEREGGRQ